MTLIISTEQNKLKTAVQSTGIQEKIRKLFLKREKSRKKSEIFQKIFKVFSNNFQRSEK